MNAPALQHLPSTEEITLLRESLREALQSLRLEAPDARQPDSWSASWNALDELGLWSTIEPPEGSLAAAAVVAEELGRVLYAGPACEALAAAYVRAGVGDPTAFASATGVPQAVLAISAGVLEPTPATTVDATLVPAIAVAPETMLIVVSGRDVVVIPAAETESRDVPSLDVSRRLTEVRMGAAPPTVLTSAGPDLARYGRSARALLYCADTLGCVDHVVARTVEYAKQRTTFGAAIGKYQAVAHRLVDHTVTARQMRLLLEDAIAAFDGRAADLERRLATVETFFSARAVDIVSDCIQLAGAIGFTWEFGHHFYLRRVAQNASLGSGPGRPHQRLAQESLW